MIEQLEDGNPKATPRPQNAHAYIPLPGSVPIDITALTDQRCRWPVDVERGPGLASPWAFCGLPVTQHRYCKSHGRLAYRGLPASRT